tara:strand:+ start:4763 stop:5893 length:1131 start_codon:yes stop_codon:yes gene_type:complete
MKIAIITSRYPSLDNPYNHMFVHMRSKEFVRKGEKVEVFVPSRATHEYVFEGISVKHMPSKDMIQYLSNYDVLYLHLLHIYPFMQQDGWPIYKSIMKNKFPCVMYVHGSEVQKYSARPFDANNSILGILRRIKKDFLLVYFMRKFANFHKVNKSLFFLFPSLWMKKEMEKNLEVEVSNFELIPNGIETNLFTFSNLVSKRFKLISLRPLSSMKYAVDIAIETVRLLPKEYTLDIFGKGKYEKVFQELINKYSLEDRITIHNTFINKHDMPEHFSGYGVSLSTTRMDAQGVSMCEAMSSGLLTVSNNNTAIPEFISDMETGILGNSPQELADKILTVTSDKELFENITQQGRETMEKIDVKLTCKQELKILKEIAKR